MNAEEVWNRIVEILKPTGFEAAGYLPSGDSLEVEMDWIRSDIEHADELTTVEEIAWNRIPLITGGFETPESLLRLKDVVEFWNRPENSERIRPLILRIREYAKVHLSADWSCWTPDLVGKELLDYLSTQDDSTDKEYREFHRSKDPSTWDDNWIAMVISEYQRPFY